MKLKQLGPVVLLSALSACTFGPNGCGTIGSRGDDGVAGPTRGKQDVLFFFPEDNSPVFNGRKVVNGLEDDVLVPARLSNPNGQGHITYDFEGTTLEAESNPGATVLRTWQSASHSHHFTFRCEPSDESARDVEVRVRVRAADGSVRYADATDVNCVRPGWLGASADGFMAPGSTAMEPLRVVVVGTKLGVTLEAREHPEDNTSLAGRGALEWATPGVLRQVREGPVVLSESFDVEAVAPGAPPRVRLGGLETPLNVKVVADEDVQLSVDVLPAAPGAGWIVQANAYTKADPMVVSGLEGGCSFDVRPDSGAPFLKEGSCSIAVPQSSGPGTVCVTVAGHPWKACKEYRL